MQIDTTALAGNSKGSRIIVGRILKGSISIKNYHRVNTRNKFILRTTILSSPRGKVQQM